MTTYLGFSLQSFERVANTTLAEHMREVEETMLRNLKFLALLESAGRITYNHSGNGFTWDVQYRLHNTEGNTGETERRWERANLWKVAALDYRGYQATDMMYQREFQQNKGPEGIVKIFDGMVDRLDTSVRQALGRQFFINGDLPENAEFWQGLDTIFKSNGTLNYTDGTQRAANQDDYVAYPTGKYADIEMQPGFYGGDNQTGLIWPDGIADPEFDFWSAIHVLYNSNRFGGATKTFKDQGEEAMRYGLLAMQRNADIEDQVTQIWLGRSLYRDHLNRQDNRQEIQVQSNYTVRALGFQSTSFDGVEVTWEPTVAPERGYGTALMNMSLRNLFGQLLFSEGPEYDMKTQSFRAAVSNLSNFKYKSPRNFLRFSKHTDLAS